MSLVIALPAAPVTAVRRGARAGWSHAVAGGGRCGWADAQPARAAPPPISFADIVERVAPAVVNIATTKAVAAAGPTPEFPFPEPPPGSPFEDFFREFFDRDRPPEQMPQRQSSLGSGFVVDRAGYVVTNNHVIAEADEIQVVFGDETTYDAELVGPRPEDRSGAAQDRGRQAVPGGDLRRQRPRSGSATGSSRSATPSASAAR